MPEHDSDGGRGDDESVDSLLRLVAECPDRALVSPVIIGSALGSYRIERCLGEGGMGSVWQAIHRVTGRRVAIKVLRTRTHALPDLYRRVMREARATVLVNHANVVTVLDVLETADGSPALVMDLLEGTTLRARLSTVGRLRLEETAGIFVQVLAAVRAAHAAGVIHRDLKPDNIFLLQASAPNQTAGQLVRHGAPANEPVTVKVLDFGIAKLVDAQRPLSEAETSTEAGRLLGTPAYMAPEQLFCERPIDRAVDVWALGVILYECLAGVRPLPGRHIGQMVRHLESEGIVPLEELDPTIPRDVARLVARMLRFDRRERLDDLAHASRVLERYAVGQSARRAATANETGAPGAPVDGVDAVAVGRVPPSRPARALSYIAAAAAAFLLIPSLSAPRGERGADRRDASATTVPPAPAPPKESSEPKRVQELVVETTAPRQSGWARMLRLWSKAVAKRTEGRLTIDVQHGGAHPFHGGEASMLSRMRTGQTDGAALSTLTLAKIHPGVMALQVPGILDEWDELDRARAAVRDELDAVFRTEGYVIAAWGDVGRVYIMSRGYRVRRPEDLRQRRAVMMEADPLAPTVYSLMRGAVPVPLGSPDVLPALRRGPHGAGITAVAAPALLAEELQWGAWLDNVTLLPAVCAIGATVLREQALEPLPADTREIALELARRIEPEANAVLRKLDAAAFARLLKRVDGVKLSREETRAWHHLFESASEKFAQGIIPDELLSKVRRAALRPSVDHRLVAE